MSNKFKIMVEAGGWAKEAEKYAPYSQDVLDAISEQNQITEDEKWGRISREERRFKEQVRRSKWRWIEEQDAKDGNFYIFKKAFDRVVENLSKTKAGIDPCLMAEFLQVELNRYEGRCRAEKGKCIPGVKK